jgi:hypothetical protein
MKNGVNLGALVMFVSLIGMHFVPSHFKLPCAALLYFSLAIIVIVDIRISAKKILRATRKVACSCVRAKKKAAQLGALLSCTACGGKVPEHQAT